MAFAALILRFNGMAGVGLVALGLPGLCQAASLAPQALFQKVAPQVAVLELADEAGAVFSAHSAIAIGSHRFITTCEVISGVPKLSLATPDGHKKASLVQQDAKRNLCVLEASEASGAGADILDSQPQVGDRVYAVSNALALGIGITEGVVSGVRSFGSETYIQFTAAIAPGSEGGGLFDAEGRLLGVIDYRRRDGQNINFAAPAKWIGEIGSRQVDDGKRVALQDRANALARQRQWTALSELATSWTHAYPEDADAWFWLGAMAEYEGAAEKAERAYRAVLRLEPASLKASLGLARVLVGMKKNDEALSLARGLLAGRQEDSDVWLAIAQVELSMGRLDMAEQAFRQAIGINPWVLIAHYGLAAIAEQRRDWEGLVAVRRQLADLRPDSADAQLRLADAYLRQGRPARALVIVDRVLQDAPDDGDAWYWKGLALARLERPLDAIGAFKRSLSGKPRSPAWVWGALGDIDYELKLWRESVAAYRECLKLEPDGLLWRWKLGLALKDSFQFDEAMALFKDYAKTYPNDPAGWRQIGFVHGYRNEVPESIGALEHSLNLDPKQAKVWLGLMEQYLKAGRREDMLRAYKELRPLDRTQAEQAYLWFVMPTEVMP